MTTPLDVAAFALRAAVAVQAVAVVQRRREHLPVAVFLITVTALDIARWVLNAGPLAHPGPYTGAARLVFHVDQAAFLAWPFGVAAMAWTVFLRRPARAPLVAYTLVTVAICAAYPTLRQQPLAWAYAGAHGAGVITGLACAAVWTRRHAPPRSEHVCALLIILMDLALFAGPYAPPAPSLESWSLAQIAYAITWGAVAALQVGILWFGLFSLRSRPSSSSSYLH